MNIKSITELIKSLVPEIKAQVAEQMKLQDAENAIVNLTVNVHTGDNVTVNVPPGTDLKRIATTNMTTEIADRIQQRTLEDLSAQQPQLESLPDREAARVVIGTTLASMAVVAYDQVTMNEKVDVKITPSSTE